MVLSYKPTWPLAAHMQNVLWEAVSMNCDVCEADINLDCEGCYILIQEIDYHHVISDRKFCSFRCVDAWYK